MSACTHWMVCIWAALTAFSPSRALATDSHRERPASIKNIELVKPGKTSVSELRQILGSPRSVVREGPTREYYFFDLGEGSTMDATISLRRGVVDYISYLCSESLKEVREKYGEKPSSTQTLRSKGIGYYRTFKQAIYEEQGRGFVYDSKSQKVKACLVWRPGEKFEELGS
ncbi:MAG: hypothetical protein AB1540_11945 [Bdellovibrionota bacterium]